MPRAKKPKVRVPRQRGEGSVDVIVANQLYLLRWREPDSENPSKTHRRSKRFHGTETEAYREQRHLQSMADTGKCQPISMTLQQLADEFLADRELAGRRLRSLEFHDDNIRVQIVPGLGAKSRIDQITSAMCWKLLMSLRLKNSRYGRPYSKNSIDAFRRTMNALFNFTRRKKYIETNPVADIRLPDGDPNAPPDIKQIQEDLMVPVLTAAQRQKLVIVAAGDEFYVAICLAIVTGKRRGEILGIKWADIDFETGKILIYKSVQRQRGKGIVPGPIKGKHHGQKKVSFVVVGPQMLELLKQHHERQQRIKDALDAAYSDEDWVFCRHDGKMWDPKTFTAHVKKLYAEIGLPENLTLHNLRDDYTTARIDRGDSIEEVSEDLDHESVATTRGYDHETVERKKKAALEIENGLHFPAPPITGQYAKVHFADEQVTLGSVRDQHASFTI